MSATGSKNVTGPSWDPNAVYPSLPDQLAGVNYSLSRALEQHHLEGSFLNKTKDALTQTTSYLKLQQSSQLGFQANQHIDYATLVQDFLGVHVNNIGDPFVEGNFTINTKFMERAVLDYYASLWRAKWPHTPSLLNGNAADQAGDTYWGFLLTMGSTEGNMYALWSARDYLTGKILLLENDSSTGTTRLVYRQAPVPEIAVTRARSSLPTFDKGNYYSPVVFYSEDTHYSFAKAIRLVALPKFSEVGNDKYKNECPVTDDGVWPSEVPSTGGGLGPGTIDIEKLKVLVEFFAVRGHPVIVSLNYGSTFKGAYDDVKVVHEMVKDIFEKHGILWRPLTPEGDMVRTSFWIHVDGALGASYMPYLNMAHEHNITYKDGSPVLPGPEFDFSLEFVHSMAMSGHKWMGAPIPCGLFMTKRKYQLSPPSVPTYIGAADTTFAGSRNGFSAALTWTSLSKHTIEEQIEKAVFCQEMAMYMEKALKTLEEELSIDMYVARSPLAITVRFRRLNNALVHKYTLSNETLNVGGGKVRYYSHVFMMEHVTTELMDRFVDDIRKQGEKAFFDFQKESAVVPIVPRKALDNDIFPVVYDIPFQGRGFSGNY